MRHDPSRSASIAQSLGRASWKKPKSVEFWGELPKNPGGKIMKASIRERYWEGHQRLVH